MNYQINRSKYLSKQEMENLENLIMDDWSRNSIIIKLAIATGSRAQELLNITINDLDDNDRTVLIKGLKGSNDRSIPIEKSLYNALKGLRSKNNRIFDISYQTLVKIWKQYTPNKFKSFKSLRHSFAIYQYKRTKDIMLIKEALGHKSLENTNVYAEEVYKNEKKNYC